MNDGLLLAIFVGLIVYLWLWSTRARERVIAISRTVCRDLNFQALDESVALCRIAITREYKQWRIERIYQFEFSSNGADRRKGQVCLHGISLAWVRIEHPDGRMFIDTVRGFSNSVTPPETPPI